jgi:hypothetical protein
MSTTEYIQTFKEQVKPKANNYLKFNDGDKKTLIFKISPETAYMIKDELYGERAQFIVTDVTDPIRPVENLIWKTSKRWARMVASFVEDHEECLTIERQGSGTNTQYIMKVATQE